MASGKSLELSRTERPEPDAICVGCGKLWSLHLKKKPNKHGYRERLKQYESFDHRLIGTIKRTQPKPTKAERRAAKKERGRANKAK
jgi:hypothetical protein